MDAPHEPFIGHGRLMSACVTKIGCCVQIRLLCFGWTLCCASPPPICFRILCYSLTLRHCMSICLKLAPICIKVRFSSFINFIIFISCMRFPIRLVYNSWCLMWKYADLNMAARSATPASFQQAEARAECSWIAESTFPVSISCNCWRERLQQTVHPGTQVMCILPHHFHLCTHHPQ